MKQIFVDTDILIDFSKGKDQFLTSLLEDQLKGNVELFINPVVLAEFFTDKQLQNKDKYKKAREFIAFFSQIDINSSIGFVAGELLQTKTITYLGDALIAATCFDKKLILLTRNKKHFEKISELEFYT